MELHGIQPDPSRLHDEPRVDLIFPAAGASIPRDHGYALYAAISRLVPSVHESRDIGIFPIRGTSAGNGTLLLADGSALRLRLPTQRLPELLKLAGKALDLDGHRFRVGVPRVAALVPAAALSSPLVVIKLAHAAGTGESGIVAPDAFLTAAKKKLIELSIQADPGLQLTRAGPRAGEPRRRIIKVKTQTHVGYAMLVQGLTADESIRLQEQGLGGRRLMGCGLFLPTTLERETQ